MSRKKIKSTAAQANKKVNVPNLVMMTNLLKESISKTEQLMSENRRLNAEISSTLEEHENRIYDLESQLSASKETPQIGEKHG